MRNAELHDKSFNCTRNDAFRILTYRPRSRAELVRKLRDKEHEDAVIDLVVADLERLGYVNDREFARQWAGGRSRLSGFGRRRIEQELRSKGVERQVIEDALADAFGEAPEAEVALREARKKMKSLARFEPEVRRRRLAGFLERKGFPSAVVYDVFRRLREE